MARTFDSQRLRIVRDADRRLTTAHRELARQMGGEIARAAMQRNDAGLAIVPNTRSARANLKARLWSQVVKPFYAGHGDDAFADGSPQSPYARLLFEGIQAVTRLAAERQAAILRRVVHDEAVLQWLTGPRPLGRAREIAPLLSGRITEQLSPTAAALAGLRTATGRIDMGRARRALVRPKGAYDPYHEWVDPNGYRLSDRVWRAGIDVRSNIDAFLDFHIGQGTSAVDMAAFLEDYLTPGARLIRTRRPYGKEGSFAARRLARTEITRAAGAATINASIANPFVTGVQWRLSGSHRDIDICNQYATGGPNGDGIYPPDQVPAYPSHPNEMCSLVPVPTGDVGELINSLRTEIRAASPIADELRGLFNPEFLARTILSGGVDDILGALASM